MSARDFRIKNRPMRRLAFCAIALFAVCSVARAASEPPHSAELDDMIIRQAKRHGVPEKLVRRIVMRESRYNPRARNHSFWGLMQISYPTARSMGFKGSPNELLDPLVNLTYAVPYLANAFVIAGKEEDAAVRLYASGYYATGKSRNLLGSLRTADSKPLGPDEGFIVAAAKPVTKLITAVVEGPPSAQVAAVAPEPRLATISPDGLAPEMMMRPGKAGNELPQKWAKDGGMTVVSRGEQRIELVAAYVATTAQPGKPSHGRARKTAEFASLDLPPPNAQAYAAPGADPREGIQRTEPLAAITQATSNPDQTPPSNSAVEETAVKPRKRGHHAAVKPAEKTSEKASASEAVEPAAPRKPTKPVHSSAKKDAVKKKDVSAKRDVGEKKDVAVALQGEALAASPTR